MKKSFILIISFGIIAMMTGCGSSSSASSSPASTNPSASTETSKVAFETSPEQTSVVKYSTTAKGEFPPAPPTSSLQSAQEEANSRI